MMSNEDVQKMHKLSEEEIINKLSKPQKYKLEQIIRMMMREGIENFIITRPAIINGILDLYNKEKEKNKELQKYMKEYLIPR